MIAAFARVAIVALGLVASPVIAGPDEDRAALVRLQQEDARLQSIGWRLATANAPFCAPRSSIGLLLQDMANFTDPARMRAATGIAGDIAVQAVAAGSPAEIAGLAASDEIVAIDRRAMADLPPAKAGDWQRLASLHDLVDAALDRDGEVRIAFRRAGDESREVTVGSNQTCPSRFELIDNSERAVADGHVAAESCESFFETCDVLSLHLRLNDSTRGIVRLSAGEHGRIAVVEAGMDARASQGETHGLVADVELRRIEGERRCLEHGARARRHVESMDRGRRGERRDRRRGGGPGHRPTRQQR